MMEEYHKIQTVFKRDPGNKYRTLLEGTFSLPEFEYLQKNIWIYTEKVDGTNIRIMYDGRTITFGGRTDRAMIPEPLGSRLTNTFLPMFSLFQQVFQEASSVCLYGEGYGAKIQKGGGNYRSDQDFVLFDVKIGDWWLQREDVFDIAQKLGIAIVPVIGEGSLLDMVQMAQKGLSSSWGNFKAEGIVARPQVELRARNGHRIITKIKYKDF